MSGSRADTHEAWLPKASLSYDLTEGVMPYIGVSRGFRYGRNLLDEEYATRQVRSGGNWAGRAGEPLVVGANLSFRF